MADRKISELTQITGANVDDANDEIAIVDTSASETKAITRGELFSGVASGSFDGDVTVGGNLTVNGTTVTIDTTTLDVADKNITIAKDAPDAATADGAGLTVDGANATITYDSTDDTWDFNKGISTTGDIEVTGTVDGRDVAADGSKLDGIESNATADQTAGEIKTAYESNANTNVFTDADESKLDGIETNADVTDTANVTAAGALMDSELTSEASVKALDQGVATTDSPEFAGLTVDTNTLYVDSANNRVGIGTSSPDEALTIEEGSVKTRIALGTTEDHHTFANPQGTRFAGMGLFTGSADLYIEDDTGDSITFDRSANDIKFETDNSEAMRINSNGNLLVGATNSAPGVGNTDPGVRLSAAGSLMSRDGASTPLFLNQNQDGAILRFYRSGSQVGSVSVTTSTTSYNTSSDERLKENIADAQPASDLIDGIQVRQFDWKADGEHQRYGMVAQELETVAPEAVTKGETEDDMWSVDYSKLVPMLVKEIQDLRKRVADLET